MDKRNEKLGKRTLADLFDMEDALLHTNWEDVICPICLEFPHNSVLLQCSSYEKGCRPFVCDTGHLLSNCLYRFGNAYGVSSPPTFDDPTKTSSDSKTVENKRRMACPLCRGEVTGCVVVDEARLHLDKKKRCCQKEKCTFSGTYLELLKHAQLDHPNYCPSKIDPARQLDWETFQMESERHDVLETIFSEYPGVMVMGDYLVENDESAEDDDEDDL